MINGHLYAIKNSAVYISLFFLNRVSYRKGFSPLVAKS